MKSNYSIEEVTVLVEEYAELVSKKYRQAILIRLIDLDLALKSLSKVHREAVFLCGMCSLTTRSAGKLIGVSKDTMHRRYLRGLSEITSYLNGG